LRRFDQVQPTLPGGARRRTIHVFIRMRFHGLPLVNSKRRCKPSRTTRRRSSCSTRREDAEMFLGIEIGGTKLQLGVGTGDGALTGLWRRGVDVAAGGEGIRRQIVAAIPELLASAHLNRSKLNGIGIGFGGPVDDATRSVLKSHQVGGWEGFPLAAWAEQALGLPTVLGNDADCGALAEATCGAGKGLTPVFYMTIGSGIGGGLVINGEVYRGSGKGAVEVGHLRVTTPDGPTPLELVASGWAIDRAAGRSGQEVADAAARGDASARAILDRVCDYLAEALCHVIALMCPRCIVIGGGVSLMGDVLFNPLRRKVAERVFKPFADCYEIVPAALGEEVVVHGALRLAATRSLRRGVCN
jgi:glucokinase